MSQYSSPYSLPQGYPPGYGYYDPTGQILAPAKRAGLTMIILGSLILAYFTCNAGYFFIAGPEDLAQNPMIANNPNAPHLTSETMKKLGVGMSVALGAIGLAMIVLGVVVRRGHRSSIVASIVISAVMALVFAGVSLLTAIAGIMAPILFACSCGSAIPLGVVILILYWLVQGLKATAQLQAVQMQYQAQMWQYQQTQQAYGQGGAYGYGYPAQPPPPPPNDLNAAPPAT
jgi:hypothetical protein